MENQPQQIWREDYKITSYLVNLRGRAGLYAILNLIQDVGWMHAIHAQVKLPENMTWVFTRQKLMMQKWPAWNEKIQIRTWLRPPVNNTFFLRDYEIILNEEKIGECTSTFTVMDIRTRKMVSHDWSAFSKLWRTEGHLLHQPQKIVFNSTNEELAEFEVRNSDLDMNNHVNNTRYAQWVLDALPLDILRGGVELQEYEVNFLAETKLGDHVRLQRADTQDQEQTQFQGIRATDQKAVFTARLKVKEK